MATLVATANARLRRLRRKKLDGQLGHLHPVDPKRVAEARARLVSAEDATRLASLLAMMADPMRAHILYALDAVDGPAASSRCLAARFHYSVPVPQRPLGD